MRLFFFALLFLAVSYGLFPQRNDYFQQTVNYKINVKLNDVKHELDGFIEIQYTNNSNQSLDYLYFHLWPNAYKNTQTAYARQAVENKDTGFWFSKKEDRGYIDQLDFRINGNNVNWYLDSVHIDICKIILPEPLPPATTITITTPFHVKIPKTFSRLGHEGQSYQISQWYPKPAVFDKDGWHPMPYLDQGEFYSEYGSFDVSITLPRNYVVGATGYLQNREELQWLDSLAETTRLLSDSQLLEKKNPPSDTIFKTLHYTIDNVHDFAWFADKRYHVLKGTIELPQSKRRITTWAMFTHVNAPYWKNAISYINDAIASYSRWIGEYPYEVCTAVQGALSAGGGMEYPTITIIGRVNNAKALETVILHEVGHNWFQGILGSNERRHPWMDEGINSFYEQRYLKQKYPDHFLIGKQENINRYLGTDFFRENELLKLAYQTVAALRKSQPLGLSSEHFTKLNYGITVYGKGAWAVEYLRSYLGDSVFDAAMHEYFNRWQWKHPQPDDLKNVLEAISGKNLNWFFNDLLHTTTEPYYKIKSVKTAGDNSLYYLRLKNKNSVLYPISVGVYRKNERKNLLWLDGFKKDTTVAILKNPAYGFFCLDCENTIPALHRSSFYKQKKFKLKFLAAYDRPDQLELFFAPWIGWNNYDKTTLGMALYNHTIPHKNFTFELLPQYAFGTKTAVGMGRVGYTFFMPYNKKLHHIDFSVSGRRFGWQLFPEALMYNKLQPALSFQLNPKHPRSPISRMLVLRNINIWQETHFYNLQEKRKILEYQYYYVNEAAFYCMNSRALNPVSWSVAMQQSTQFIKFFAEARFTVTYNKPNKGLHIRYFIGGFAWENIATGNVPDPRLRMNFSSGFGPFIKDYTFDELLLGRSDYSGFFSQQIVYRDGGFKTLTALGQTNRWLSAVNISSNVPGRIPIKPFISIGAYGDKQSRLNMAFEAGFTIFLLSDIIELHLPIATLIQANFGTGKQTYKWHVGMRKDDTDNMHSGSRYHNLITFTFNLHKLNPFEFLRKLEF